jgi:ABC-type phosphate transport system substrate-binding protein
MKRNSRTLTAITAVAGVAALGVIAPSAQASFFTGTQAAGVCQGADSLHGIGASGVKNAQIAWGDTQVPAVAGSPLSSGFGYDAGADYAACQVFKSPTDGGTKTFDYESSGSGSCLDVLGATSPNITRQYIDTSSTVNNVAYCGTEEAPTDTAIANAEAGPATASNHPSEAQLMTIPVGQVADTIVARLPDGCQVANPNDRVLTRAEAEGAFEGTITTWNGIFGTTMTATASGGQTSAGCRAKAFKRVVRPDESGTSFLIKRYLQAALPSGDTTDWREPAIGGTLDNTAWPNDSGATAVVRGSANGGGALADALTAQGTNGGIGYIDLATARSKDYGWTFTTAYAPDDTKIWLKVQRVSNDTFNSPAISNAETTSGTNLGAACTGVQYSNAPTTDLGASWSPTSAVPTPTDYPICGLEYFVTSLWGFDTGNSRNKPVFAGSNNQGEWRAAKDYIRYVLGVIRPGVGPAKLPTAGYAKLPADILATAKCQVNIMGFFRASGDPAPGSPIPRAACP